MNFDIKHVLKESQGTSLQGVQTILGEKALDKGLLLWSTSKDVLERRAQNVLLLRKYLQTNPHASKYLEDTFKNIANSEEIFKDTANDATSWKDKTSEQIFFESGGVGGFLNHIPGIVALLVFMKVWAAPILAIATPFLMIILPYFMLQFVYHISIPWDKYQSIVLDMFVGERTLSFNSISKVLYFIVSMSQAIVQPFLTSIAVKKLDVLVKERAESLYLCRTSAKEIFQIFKEAGIDTLPHLPYADDDNCTSPYLIFAKDKDESWTTQYLGQLLGDAEIIYCLAKDSRFLKPVWLHPSSDTILELTDFHDISIGENPKRSNVKFSKGSPHSLLTGPNRGGKSSSLRGIIQNVLWAQTYGLTPCPSYKGQIFSWIVSSLRAEDRPGATSLFEREIEIATDILRRAARTPHTRGLVLIDEIFHSTNPPDGEKSARIFLEKLWSHNNVISCVSTHVYSIVEDAPKEIQKLCCSAEEDEDGYITYNYSMHTGICKVSSVDDVLREKGLIPLARSKLTN